MSKENTKNATLKARFLWPVKLGKNKDDHLHFMSRIRYNQIFTEQTILSGSLNGKHSTLW